MRFAIQLFFFFRFRMWIQFLRFGLFWIVSLDIFVVCEFVSTDSAAVYSVPTVYYVYTMHTCSHINNELRYCFLFIIRFFFSFYCTFNFSFVQCCLYFRYFIRIFPLFCIIDLRILLHSQPFSSIVFEVCLYFYGVEFKWNVSLCSRFRSLNASADKIVCFTYFFLLFLP